MSARYYNPTLGRFISPDPVHFIEGNIHSFNRYAYANNNPMRYIDPTGLEGEEISEADKTEKSVAPQEQQVAMLGFFVNAARTALGLGVKEGAKQAAKEGAKQTSEKSARELAKDAMLANKKAPEINSTFGWGNGQKGIDAAKDALAKDPQAVVGKVQGSMSRAEVEATRDLYNAAAKEGKGAAIATQRAEYVNQILSHWK